MFKKFGTFIKRYWVVILWGFTGIFVIISGKINTLTYSCCFVTLIIYMIHGKRMEHWCEYWRKEVFGLIDLLHKMRKENIDQK
jgi:hypothetical protein